MILFSVLALCVKAEGAVRKRHRDPHRVRDELFELLRESLGGRIVRVVKRAIVEVRYARDVVVVRAEVVLDGRDLVVKRDEAPGGGKAVPAAVRTSL